MTRAQSGERVELRPGQELVVRLPENPSTGYRWAVGAFDTSVLAQESSEYTAGASSAPGASGERVLCFRALAAGNTRLELKNYRAWEGEASALEKVEYTVRVST